jgi:hypothetical protein
MVAKALDSTAEKSSIGNIILQGYSLKPSRQSLDTDGCAPNERCRELRSRTVPITMVGNGDCAFSRDVRHFEPFVLCLQTVVNNGLFSPEPHHRSSVLDV